LGGGRFFSGNDYRGLWSARSRKAAGVRGGVGGRVRGRVRSGLRGDEADADAGQVGAQGAIDVRGEAVLEPLEGVRGANVHHEAVSLEGEGSRAPEPVVEGPAFHVQGEVLEGPFPEIGA
jgi:hypothetical protein